MVGMRRAMAGLWLMVYALVAVAVPVADATASHAPVVAHWEDATDSSCPPRHDASVCQVCQANAAAGSLPAASPAPLAPVALATAAGVVPDRAGDVPEPERGTPPSRGPPAA
jgi:hypothetical protein